MHRLGLLLIILFISALCRAQENKFGQPQVMGKEINSAAEEIGPFVSADGKSLYFTRTFDPANKGGKFGGSDIWVSRKDSSEHWTAATNRLRFWNNDANNAVIGIRADKRVVYLLNAYTNKSGIAYAKVSGSKPEFIPVPGIDGKEFIGLFIDPGASILLISMKGADSYGQEDLYVSTRNLTGQWTEPANLGPTINTDGFEIAPFLSADGRHLYFSSSGHQGLGDADIFVAERLYNSWTVWTKPKNLGAPINSPKFDSYFSVGTNGNCYFTSNRDSKFADIFECKMNIDSSKEMKDSVRQLVKDTRKLLSDLRTPDNEVAHKERTEFISFSPQSKDLSAAASNQLKLLLQQPDRKSLMNVELIGYSEEVSNRVLAYSLSADRIKAIQQKLAAAGIDQKIIKTRVVQDAARMTNKPRAGVEIRLAFPLKPK